MTDSRPAPSRKRPFALVILAGIMLLKALLILIVLAGSALVDTRIGAALAFPDLLDEQVVAVNVLLVFVAALLIVSALGVLSHQRTGWLLAMVTTGVFIAFDIYGFLQGDANHIWMLLNIITVFYLNQREVRIGVGAMGTPAIETGAGRTA